MNRQKLSGLKITPRVWAYVNKAESSNPDLDHYRGYFDLQTTLGFANSFILDTHFGWAKEGPSVYVDLTYPLHVLFGNNLDVYFQVQYSMHSGKACCTIPNAGKPFVSGWLLCDERGSVPSDLEIISILIKKTGGTVR
jgi:hypothetical protein